MPPLPAGRVTTAPEALRGMALPALAALWASGTNLPWEAIWDGPVPQRVGLPNYPFAAERHWPAGLTPLEAAQAPEPDGPHPLIERVLPSLQGAGFAVKLDAAAPLLGGHRVDGAALLPGTAVLELARAAVALTTGEAISTLADVAWLAPLPAGAKVVLSLREDVAGLRFELTSAPDGRRLLHASGLVPASQDGPPPPVRNPGGLEAALPQRLEGAAIYARLAQLGVAYGEPFQGLARIAFDADTALAWLHPVVLMPGMPWQPALLDAAFQATMGLLGAAGQIEPLVPFLAESARVFAPLGEAMAVLVRRAPLGGAGGVVVDIEVLGAHGEVLAAFGRVTLRRRAAEVAAGAAAPGLAGSPLDRLDRLAASRMLAQWQRHGVFAAPAQRCTRAEIAQALRLHAGHARLLAAALDLFGQRGWIRQDGEAWCALPTALEASRDWQAAQDALAAAEPTLAPHLELLDRCMASLDGILDGSIPASEAFFPDGSMELLARVYAGDDNAAFLHGAAAQAVVQAVRAAGASPRVLEIGAGTGGTTGPVLHALRRAALSAEFVFTDLSPRFLQQARERFGADHAGFRTTLLDISRDPAEQGLAGGFDVVLAANVLHATPEMRETLRHAAALLTPGGTLVVNEMTAARDYATLTFGLLEGWWLANDPASRLPHAPLLSIGQWRCLLAESGLEVAAVTLPPAVTEEAATPQAVLVARKAAARPEAAVAAPMAMPAAAPACAPPQGSVGWIEDAVTEAVAAVFEMPVETVRLGGILSFSELGGDSCSPPSSRRGWGSGWACR
ncbi:methyltransferase [Siccirubricoccus deserti]